MYLSLDFLLYICTEMAKKDNIVDLSDTRIEFISLCNLILTTKDPAVLCQAYEMFFTSYKYMIMMGAPTVRISLLEEVIYKIVNDEDDEFPYAYYGFKYNPFERLLGMAKEQEPWLRQAAERRKKGETFKGVRGITEFAENNPIKKYIFLYATKRTQATKSAKVKDIVNRCFRELHDEGLLHGGINSEPLPEADI